MANGTFVIGLLIGILMIVGGSVAGTWLIWTKKIHLPRKGIRARVPKKQATSMSKVPPPPQVKVGRNIPIEITAVNKEGTARVVVLRGKVPRSKIFVMAKHKDQPKYGLHFVDLRGLWKDGKLHFQREICEPIDEQGQPVLSPELDRILADSGMVQITDAIAVLGSPIHFSRATMGILIFVGIVFLTLGLSLNGIFHFVPNTVVHWLPSAPRGS